MNQLPRLFLSAIIVLNISACSTVLPSEQSGFLTSYGELSPSADGGANSRHSAVRIDPSRASIAAVEWRGKATEGLSTEEKGMLLAKLRAELQAQVASLPRAENGRPVRIRAVITQVVTVSPSLNAVSALLAGGPWDRGGAALEIEAVDTETDKQVAALTLGYFPPLTEFTARFSRLAPAQLAIQKGASDFGALMRP
jgi:hypothetical protein